MSIRMTASRISWSIAILTVLSGWHGIARAYSVVRASHDVRVDCGTNGTNVPTDWYFPQPNPNRGLVWVQHGFARANNQMVDLSTKLAAEGYVVFATSLAPGSAGCAMNNAGFLSDVSRLFPDLANPAVGLLASAQAAAQSAGISLPALPPTFAFAGHSAGGGSIAHVARMLVENAPTTAANLRGLVMLDPVEGVGTTLIADALPVLAGRKIYAIASPPYTCNSNANGTVALASQPRPFVGVRLTSGSHCDAEGASTDSLCTLFCGTSQQANVDALQTLAKGWLADLFAPAFTPSWYPSGDYYQARLAEGRIVTLPENGTCGNGTLDPGETCDDGGRANGDCCNAICDADPLFQACAPDGNPCTVDACDGSGHCAHPAGNAGTVCRAASGACDVPETCTGASPVCPADVPPPDVDGDGRPDACDPCSSPTPITAAKLVLRKVGAPAGDDKLSFAGAFPIAFPFVPNVDPPHRGARLVLEDGDGDTLLDASIPAGAYDPVTRAGWRSSPGKWSWSSAVGIAGLTKVQIALDPAHLGVVHVKATGRGGAFAPAVLPVNLTVVLDPPNAPTGQCATSAFSIATPPICRYANGETTVSCR